MKKRLDEVLPMGEIGQDAPASEKTPVFLTIEAETEGV